MTSSTFTPFPSPILYDILLRNLTSFLITFRYSYIVWRIKDINVIKKSVRQGTWCKTAECSLSDVINDSPFIAYLCLLYEVRNTIHGAALKTMVFQRSNYQKESTYVEVPQSIETILWENAELVSDTNEWGLFREFDMTLLEPYSYAKCLVKYGFSIIDKIAFATDVTLLFPDSSQIPELIKSEPENDIWQWANRIATLVG